MHIVVSHLAETDPNRLAAMLVVQRFQALSHHGASLETVLRSMAGAAGKPIRLDDQRTGGVMRMCPTGEVSHPTSKPDPVWPEVRVDLEAKVTVFLETLERCTLIEAVVMEQGVEAIRRLKLCAGTDPASDQSDLMTALTSPDRAARLSALETLRLDPEADFRVFARPGPEALIVPEPAGALSGATSGGGRIGVGRRVKGADLNLSWESALTALAFTAVGDDLDPGPALVVADDISLLSVMVEHLDTVRPDDLRDLEAIEKTANALAPWALPTLAALASHNSLRMAAEDLHVHHSTLQGRMAPLERQLGWSLRERQGQLRLALALALRRYLRHPPEREPLVRVAVGSTRSKDDHQLSVGPRRNRGATR